MDGEPLIVALANSWIIINTGGGPTDDKPSVVLEAPTDPDRVSAFLNIRVADIAAVYADWSAKGGHPSPSRRPRRRDLLLPARPRRPPDRGRPEPALTGRQQAQPR